MPTKNELTCNSPELKFGYDETEFLCELKPNDSLSDFYINLLDLRECNTEAKYSNKDGTISLAAKNVACAALSAPLSNTLSNIVLLCRPDLPDLAKALKDAPPDYKILSWAGLTEKELKELSTFMEL